MKRKVLVVNDWGQSYFKPYEHLGFDYETDVSVLDKEPDSVALVVFTGGEDVGPELYNHKRYGGTYDSPRRDAFELEVFKKARSLGKPFSGICRGAQFLCVMAGGTLVQDVTGHGFSHKICFVDENGERAISPQTITSSHHQMQNPFNLKPEEFEILGWSEKPISQHYWIDGMLHKRGSNETKELIELEPDVVFYRNLNALCMQYHPEWMDKYSWGFQFAKNLVTKYLEPLCHKQ